ncbi:zinc ribbon domain-containing protein [Streptomyces sp. NPDC048659]|uniref:zinc ribbon domain-containing protein n=1 Tax=Streptomyces sp. NPDC048659 TaxID=3155489 RepID=UPI0034414A19
MSDTGTTRPCPDCARPVRAANQSFCDECGAFLRWDTPSTRPAEARAADTAPAAPASEAPTAPLPAVREDRGRDRDEAEGAGAGGDRGMGSGAGAGGDRGTGSGAGAGGNAVADGGTSGEGAASSGTAGTADTASTAGTESPAVPEASATPAAASASRASTAPEGSDGSEGPEASAASKAPVAPVAPAVPATPTPTPTPQPSSRPAPPSSPSRPSDTVARALLVPVPESDPSVPAAVLPGRPDAPRPTVRAAEAPVAARGGAPCPACGTANSPGRHFCRLCATPLVERPLNTAEGPYAGQRPRLARDRGRWIVRAAATAGAVALLVGGIFGGPPAARAVQDHFADRAPVHPAAWRASHAAPKQGAALAGDGYSNTWWGTGYAGDSAGQYLEALFGEPTDLLAVLITPGSGKNTTRADGQATPRTFDLVVTDAGGEQHVSQHRINDGGTQKIELRVRDAVSVRLVLRTAWRADPSRQVAVAELEFFGRSFS